MIEGKEDTNSPVNLLYYILRLRVISSFRDKGLTAN